LGLQLQANVIFY